MTNKHTLICDVDICSNSTKREENFLTCTSPAPTFSINHDAYPEETSWMVITGDYESLDQGDFEVVAESPSDPVVSSTEVHRVCLPASLGDVFSFVIMDSGYDGLCCLYGDGGYVITSPDLPPEEVIGQGGEFR